MNTYRPLEELTLMDDYMFGVVMQDSALLQTLLEMILNLKIRSIRFVESQKTMKEKYQSKAIRLDLYVEDENGHIYNVEVQTTNKRNLPKRMRYYQSIIDSDVLSVGADYRELRKSYVIFICNYDPYDKSRYIYRFQNLCIDDPTLPFGDETEKIVVNTQGTVGEISPEFLETIRYLNSGAVTGEYSDRLNQAVNSIKQSEERRHEYVVTMIRERELRDEGREEGREEGRVEGRVEERREVAFSMRQLGMSEDVIATVLKTDPSLIREWFSEGKEE